MCKYFVPLLTPKPYTQNFVSNEHSPYISCRTSEIPGTGFAALRLPHALPRDSNASGQTGAASSLKVCPEALRIAFMGKM